LAAVVSTNNQGRLFNANILIDREKLCHTRRGLRLAQLVLDGRAAQTIRGSQGDRAARLVARI
jgi:hypothetical protein